MHSKGGKCSREMGHVGGIHGRAAFYRELQVERSRKDDVAFHHGRGLREFVLKLRIPNHFAHPRKLRHQLLEATDAPAFENTRQSVKYSHVQIVCASHIRHACVCAARPRLRAVCRYRITLPSKICDLAIRSTNLVPRHHRSVMSASASFA